MASYNELNALIDAYINRNGVQAITGQILNGVLKAMVEQLGRGYTIMGAAIPTTDPGTPDAPECYFASETGTYTDFDGLQVVPGELALLCYTPSDGWTKETIYEGFQTVGATIDGNVGTPSVGVSYANGVLSFDFHNMKGDTGDPAGFGTIGATVDGNIGTPSVTVQESGPATAKNLTFAFTNLKGETGVTSVVATVDNTIGTPSCAVSLNGQVLTLAFSGLKGAQGDTGVSADYPIAIVNNLTTSDAASALSAAMGVQLESEISQLEAKVTGVESAISGKSITGNEDEVAKKWYNNNGVIDKTSSSWKTIRPIPVVAGVSIDYTITNPGFTGTILFITDKDGNILAEYSANSATGIVIPTGGALLYFNSFQPFSCTITGLKDLMDDLATQESLDEVSDRQDETANQVNGVDYAFTFKAGKTGWKITNGYVASYTPSLTTIRATEAVEIEEGDLVKYRLCDGSTPHANLLYTPLIVTDENGKVLVASALTGEEDEFLAPAGAKYLYTTQGTDLVDPYVRIIKKVPESLRKYLPRVVGAVADIGLSASDFSSGQVGNIATYYGRPVSESKRIKTDHYIEVAPGRQIKFTLTANRVQFSFFDKDKVIISQGQFYTSGNTIDIPENCRYIKITISSPSGSSDTPTFAGTGLVVYTNTIGFAEIEAHSDAYIAISAPSPQLPADGSTDSDFNANTLTPAELNAAVASLLKSLPVPNSANYYNPKYATQYSVVGRDASNTYDIKAYILTERDRFGWKYADALFAWENNGTVVYTDSISPLVGATIYTDAARTDGGETVLSFDVANMAFTGSDNVVYSRSKADDVAEVVAYSKETMKKSSPTSINLYEKDGTLIGSATVSDTTHLTRSGKTYTRCEDYDFYHNQRGTIVLWGNEHGPDGDPAIISIILYRMMKDFCNGCRNNPFLLWLKRNYKMVIIPCANPYGLQNHTRVNANGVNINRNYSTPGWVNVTDEPKGSYAGDQPETQFIMNTVALFSPAAAIDIHCFKNQERISVGTMQQVGHIPSEYLLEYAYRTILGYSFNLSPGRDATPNATSWGCDWLYYQGIPGGIIEMNGGAPAEDENDVDTRNDAHSMEASYTLLLVMLRVWLAGSDPELNLGKIGLL